MSQREICSIFMCENIIIAILAMITAIGVEIIVVFILNFLFSKGYYVRPYNIFEINILGTGISLFFVFITKICAVYIPLKKYIKKKPGELLK